MDDIKAAYLAGMRRAAAIVDDEAACEDRGNDGWVSGECARQIVHAVDKLRAAAAAIRYHIERAEREPDDE